MRALIRPSTVSVLAALVSMAVPTWGEAPSAGAPAPDAKPDGAVASSRELPVVRLKYAGAEPRTTLRYTLKAGDAQWVEMVQQTTGSAEDFDSIVSIAGAVSSVEQGRGTYSFVVTGSRGAGTAADTELNEIVESSTKLIVGAVGVLEIDDRGRPLGSSLQLPPTAPQTPPVIVDAIAEGLRVLPVVLPEEAVGVGAVWSVERRSKRIGVTMTTTYTYTLNKINDGVLEAGFVQDSSAPEQTVDIGVSLPEGYSPTRLSSKGSGAGRVLVRLDRPLPMAMTEMTDSEMTHRSTTPEGERSRSSKSRSIQELREPSASPATKTPDAGSAGDAKQP